jgi:uncharacterized membrane protein YhhN
VFKPLAMAMLVLVAAVAGPDPAGVRWLVVVAAVFGVLGDAALLGSGTKWFIRGLVAFAIGHSFYVAAALVVGVEATAWWGVVFVSLLFAWRFLPTVVPAARASGGKAMMGAVLFYASIIAAMVITATGTGRWLAAGGAALFAISDWVLGQRQFVGPDTFHRLSVMVPYHVGQAMLIVGLLGVAV